MSQEKCGHPRQDARSGSGGSKSVVVIIAVMIAIMVALKLSANLAAPATRGVNVRIGKSGLDRFYQSRERIFTIWVVSLYALSCGPDHILAVQNPLTVPEVGPGHGAAGWPPFTSPVNGGVAQKNTDTPPTTVGLPT